MAARSWLIRAPIGLSKLSSKATKHPITWNGAVREDGPIFFNHVASWFETRGVAALLTMRVLNLILRRRALARVSKDEATELQVS
jgi:hypothetical protein